MPNNFHELSSLLERTSQENRNILGEIIDAPFGNSPSLLCDHLCYLRAGTIGQLFDNRDYKQLVTDVADRVGIDWASVTAQSAWESLSAEDIEAAILDHIDLDDVDVDDTQHHIPEPIRYILHILINQQVVRDFPLLPFAGSLIGDALEGAFSLLSTDWRKLLATVIYVHRVIRQQTNTT